MYLFTFNFVKNRLYKYVSKQQVRKGENEWINIKEKVSDRNNSKDSIKTTIQTKQKLVYLSQIYPPYVTKLSCFSVRV